MDEKMSNHITEVEFERLLEQEAAKGFPELKHNAKALNAEISCLRADVERLTKERDSSAACCDSYAEENQRLYDRAQVAEADVGRLTKEREQWAEQNKFIASECQRLVDLHADQRDAAEARAQSAEAERDAAKADSDKWFTLCAQQDARAIAAESALAAMRKGVQAAINTFDPWRGVVPLLDALRSLVEKGGDAVSLAEQCRKDWQEICADREKERDEARDARDNAKSAMAELRGAIMKAREFAVLVIAFIGRDQGTARIDATLNSLVKLAIEQDTALRSLVEKGGERVRLTERDTIDLERAILTNSDIVQDHMEEGENDVE